MSLAAVGGRVDRGPFEHLRQERALEKRPPLMSSRPPGGARRRAPDASEASRRTPPSTAAGPCSRSSRTPDRLTAFPESSDSRRENARRPPAVSISTAPSRSSSSRASPDSMTPTPAQRPRPGRSGAPARKVRSSQRPARSSRTFCGKAGERRDTAEQIGGARRRLRDHRSTSRWSPGNGTDRVAPSVPGGSPPPRSGLRREPRSCPRCGRCSTGAR